LVAHFPVQNYYQWCSKRPIGKKCRVALEIGGDGVLSAAPLGRIEVRQRDEAHVPIARQTGDMIEGGDIQVALDESLSETPEPAASSLILREVLPLARERGSESG
jgi:hypothetical protein